MQRQLIIALLLLWIASSTFGQKQVILDTDPSADPDDVGCMAMLHNLASLGECEILATINATHYKQSALSISAINQFYGRSAIPVGDYKGYDKKIASPDRNYDYHLARFYPRTLSSWKAAPDGVALYREVLASAEDSSITVVIIGTMHNFYDLLRSQGDDFSLLSGVELVRQKVKQVVTMGGNFIDGKGYDRTNWGGSTKLCDYTEWSCLNAERNEMCRYVINNCPSPFVASGWEVGCGDYHNANYGNVMTGTSLKSLDTSHILRRSYEYHFITRGETENISRHSNDQCALHYAIRGEGQNYRAYTDGKITLTEAGECLWENAVNNGQGYIQKKRSKAAIAQEIEALMMLDIKVPIQQQPSPPAAVILDPTTEKLSWSKSTDDNPGSWVIGYNIYADDVLLLTAYGNQISLQRLPLNLDVINITALSAAGIESEAVTFNFEEKKIDSRKY